MKNLKENIKLSIYQGVASLFGILGFIFLFLPAYFENGRSDLSLFQIMLGDGRIGATPNLIFGFVLLIIGVLLELVLLTLLLLNKSKSLVTTILSVTSGVTILIGAVLMTCGPFISGLTSLTTELGFTQGFWGFKIGMFISPISCLISIILLYPQMLIMLKHLDDKDKVAKEEKASA